MKSFLFFFAFTLFLIGCSGELNLAHPDGSGKFNLKKGDYYPGMEYD